MDVADRGVVQLDKNLSNVAAASAAVTHRALRVGDRADLPIRQLHRTDHFAVGVGIDIFDFYTFASGAFGGDFGA